MYFLKYCIYFFLGGEGRGGNISFGQMFGVFILKCIAFELSDKHLSLATLNFVFGVVCVNFTGKHIKN